MADEYLTQELPGIRRAQERSLAALDSVVRLVSWGLWRNWGDSQTVMPDQASLADLGRFQEASLPTAPKFAAESDKPASLELSTAAMCLDALEAVAEARGIQGLPKARDVGRRAALLRDRMLKEMGEVTSRLQSTDSPTFGAKDPLTASWLLPILYKPTESGSSESGRPDSAAQVKIGSVALLGLLEEAIVRLLSPREHVIQGALDRTNTAEDHPWPVSLVVRAQNLVSGGAPADVSYNQMLWMRGL